MQPIMCDERFTALLNYARQVLHKGDKVGARKIALEIVAEYPENVEGWLILGELAHPPDCWFYLNKAKEIDPDNPSVQSALALAQPQEEEKETHLSTLEQKPEVSASLPQKESFLKRLNRNGFFRGAIYLGKKGLLIGLTIILGVFITISIMNRTVTVGFGTAPAQLDAAIERQIGRTVSLYRQENPSIRNLSEFEQNKILQKISDELAEEFGLNLPKLQRHLLWTWKALIFDWGRLRVGDQNPFPVIGFRPVQFNLNHELLLNYLPNTILLAGTAFFLVFLLGLPLSLTLAGHHGKWFDRFISFFAPISSIPSWVIGIILISVFAFELNILPSGRMFDALPPETRWGYIPVILRHMILPVISICLSIIFQLVYSWRTYFVTFSSEDYVELGKAMGLPERRLQRKYILKPSFSYIITSFSLMFISFWQMTMALEVVFNWPGLGWLYVVKALPNLWGESAYPGDLIISISLVVLFAYLMGFVVLLLDLVYVIVDPRIRLGTSGTNMRLKRQKGAWKKSLKAAAEFGKQKPSKNGMRPGLAAYRTEQAESTSTRSLPKIKLWKKIKQGFGELKRYPEAIIGLCIILILIVGSLYAVIFLPYGEIGEQWRRESFTGQSRVPKLAKPAWINWFSGDNYLSVINLDSEKGEADKEVNAISEKTDQILLTYTFDYEYSEFPTEVFIYLSGDYKEKRPFASLLWKTPDGREIALENSGFSDASYVLGENFKINNVLSDFPGFKNWYKPNDSSHPPEHYLLFADPDSNQAELLPGQYQLVIDGLVFEPEGDIDAELVLLGQVYGAAGTDFYRRDLLVPLLWGMPAALLLGLFGALSTTIVSMLFAATGVWFGGWVDNLVQRLIDVNLVLPILAISVMAYAFLGIDIWVILIVYVFLNAFGTPTKNFRAAFLQIKEAPYIEAAKAYGAKHIRIIFRYMVPRLIPVLIPQLVILIPSFVFLEATLGFLNIKMPYPTWGTVIYLATMRSGLFYSRYWMLQPIALLLLTGFGFSLFGLALERILNPRLKTD